VGRGTDPAVSATLLTLRQERRKAVKKSRDIVELIQRSKRFTPPAMPAVSDKK